MKTNFKDSERIARVMQMLKEIKDNGEQKPVYPVLRKYSFGRGDIKTADVVFVFGVKEIQPIHARRLIEKQREYFRFRKIKRELGNMCENEKTKDVEEKHLEKISLIGKIKSLFVEWKENRKRELNKITQCNFIYDDDGVLLKVKLSSRDKKKHLSIYVPRTPRKKAGRPAGHKESKQQLINKKGYKDAIVLLKTGLTLREISSRLAKQTPPIYISKPTLAKLRKIFC